ncbi:MAG: DUF624 domain-containing protein [Clostridia bacterium]|nr:DUF624 domain-containing protein [Clostridia bacterium]
MSDEKKRFNLFNIYNRDGRGVEKGTELKVLEKPGILNFFKLMWRRFSQLTSINMLYILGNFPIFFAIFAMTGYTSIESSSPGTGLYSALKGTMYFASTGSAAVNSPVIASLNGIYGKQIITMVPTVFTYILYGLSLLLIFTSGLVNVGCTYLLRNMIRGEHLFVWKDFWYAIKRNIKQGLIYGFLDALISVVLVYDLLWFRAYVSTAGIMSAFYFVSFAMIFIYFFMRMYIYPMMITFDLSIFKMFKNAILFTVLGIKRNIMCLLGYAAVIVINLAIYFSLMPVGIILPFLITVAICKYISVYCAYPVIKKYMIDPYYNEVKSAQ